MTFTTEMQDIVERKWAKVRLFWKGLEYLHKEYKMDKPLYESEQVSHGRGRVLRKDRHIAIRKRDEKS